ncbi:LiaF transmembrane domain-containing protein [Anaerofustis stercorihominis]|uniref:LiaF transmembrane domain-containing protein n=1 Tax=Anaerofustis stercorihominis TaxID=214853 RepID=UPI00214B8785|nr:hypothetical protein [Anaerofustis stercorihominis]MCR2033490.1 hypothetical protein [Anaerofustis stercorihominis]
MNKNLKIILGVLFILIGAGYILDLLNIHIISFNGFFRSLEFIWPLFLVVIGVYLLTSSKKVRTIFISIFLALLIAGTCYFTVSSYHNIFHNDSTFNFNDNYNHDTFNFFDY